ncbi:hypothetical protein [Streptomyces sp. GMR22]|nr:hypothetical protein [Streptomyces sp. GMR22]
MLSVVVFAQDPAQHSVRDDPDGFVALKLFKGVHGRIDGLL